MNLTITEPMTKDEFIRLVALNGGHRHVAQVLNRKSETVVRLMRGFEDLVPVRTAAIMERNFGRLEY